MSARLFYEVARRGFSRYATYRAATVAGLFTNTVFGFMRCYVLLAMFAARSDIGGFDRRDVVTYAWATQALIMTVFMWGWADVAMRIRDGAIVTDLHRPMDLQSYWLAEDLGRAAFHLLARGLPPVVVGAIAFGLRMPARPGTWLAVILSVFLAVVVSFGVRFLSNCAAFWMLDHRGATMITGIMANLLSGFIIPITFFPGWLATLARALPFASIVQIPIEVFLEKPGSLSMIPLQAMWAFVLFAAGRAAFAAGTRKLVIQGG